MRVFAASVGVDGVQANLGVATLMRAFGFAASSRARGGAPVLAICLEALLLLLTLAPYTPIRRRAALPPLHAPR